MEDVYEGYFKRMTEQLDRMIKLLETIANEINIPALDRSTGKLGESDYRRVKSRYEPLYQYGSDDEIFVVAKQIKISPHPEALGKDGMND